MKYIKKKLDSDIYAVLDTDIDEIKNYSYSELKYMYDNGTYIRGVAYIEGEFIVTPVVPLYSVIDSLMAKNKLISGTRTGVRGFDLEIEGDDIFASPLNSDFYDYVNRSKTEDKFVFVIPDGITELSEMFLVYGFSNFKHLKIFIDLPESLKVINTLSLYSYSRDEVRISGIRFSGVVNIIGGADMPEPYNYNYSCIMEDENYGHVYEFRSKIIDINAIEFSSIADTKNKSINISLPDTEWLNEFSIYSNARLNVFLGEGIRGVYPFSGGLFDRKDLPTSDIMGYSSTVYIPDNCMLSKIGLCADLHSFYEEDGEAMYGSYIAVLSDSMYRELKSRYENDEFIIDTTNDLCCWVGILTYNMDEELESIKDNIGIYLSDPEKYFSRYLTSDDFGKIIKLELKAGI